VDAQPEGAGLRERAAELWRRLQPFVDPVLIPLGLVAASVLVHLFVVWTQTRAIGSSVPPVHRLASWDGGIYLRIARDGYPTKLARVNGKYIRSTLAFYPLYPFVVRGVYRLGPFNLLTSGLIVAITSSAGMALVFWQLAARLTDRSTATRSVALLLFAPGAIALSMTYSEPLFILLACACLWALLEHRWELAGVFALLGGAARPSGIALVAACVVAAFVALRRDRQWRAITAPVLSIVGFLVVPIYDLVHVGDFFAFWKVERDGWHAHVDFGRTALHELHLFVQHPFHDFNTFMTVAAMAVILGGLVLMGFWRPPPEIVAYTLVIVALALGTATLNSTFRFAMTAVPLFVAYARVLRRNSLLIVLGVSAALFAVAGAATVSMIYTP